MEKYEKNQIQSETIALLSCLSFQGKSETTKTVGDLTLFVATMSNVSSFASRIFLNNPLQAEGKQTTDEIVSKQSEATSQALPGLSLVGSQTSALSLLVTSFAVATVAAVVGRTAALSNLPGTNYTLSTSLCSHCLFEDCGSESFS